MWNPLKKQWVDRPTPAQPCLSITEDRELDMAVQRVKSVERRIKQMDKEMKKYKEIIQHLDIADQSLTKNLTSCNLIHIDDGFKRLVDNYHLVTIKVGKTVQETVENCNKTFSEPISALYDSFSRMKSALNRREDLVNNWKSAYSSLKKYQDKKDKIADYYGKFEKQRKAEEMSSNELKVYHTTLLNELLMFLDESIDYLTPTVNALITIQLAYYSQSTKLFTKLLPISNSSQSPPSSMIPEDEYEQTITSHLDRIRNLTIVKND